jgi:hypothetical protein
MVSSLPLFFLLLLLSAASFGGGVRLGDGGYEDWRLGTATYVKEFQSHPLNDGMCVCFPSQQKKNGDCECQARFYIFYGRQDSVVLIQIRASLLTAKPIE